MKFEEVMPALREGKTVWRKNLPFRVRLPYGDGPLTDQFGEPVDITQSANSDSIFHCDDWEVVPQVADYFVGLEDAVETIQGRQRVWVVQTLEVGKQPDHAVLVPGTQREAPYET